MPFNYIIYLLVIPALLLVVPWIIARYIFVTKKSQKPYLQYASYLWVSVAIWLVSFILPNIPLTPESDSVTLHVSGGVVAGILAIYFVKVYAITLPYWWQPLVLFYFFASGLGVANELLETAINLSGITYISNNDISWDLISNTIGASVVTVGWYLYRWLRKHT